MKKPSFFQRFSNTQSDDDFDFEDEQDTGGPFKKMAVGASAPARALPEEKMEGHLPVDMYQTQSEIIIRTFVAGVRPDEVSVSINRDMVVIEGEREERSEATGPDYFNQELFWGAFSRTIMLPHEVDVDGAQASSKDGLLTIILPKLDRTRQTKLKVKSN